MQTFNIFKGKKSRKGLVVKSKSVGEGIYDIEADTFDVNIYGLPKNSFTLKATKNVNASYDYIILYEDLDTEMLEPVGSGYLLCGKNQGLIHLEWDFFGANDIYINFANTGCRHSKSAVA